MTDQQKQLLIRLPIFARALFGEEEITLVHQINRRGDEFFDFYGGKAEVAFDGGGVFAFSIAKYEYHLQQAVISKDAVTYFYEQIFNDV